MNRIYCNEILSRSGIPLDDIRWSRIEGQPFGNAVSMNAIIFGDANNIIDVEGALAVQGNFHSPRGVSIGFGRESKLVGTGYSPDDVRFLINGNLSTSGPFVVVGHVVANNHVNVARGSTYLIGKSNYPDQSQELKALYHAPGGNQYWAPSDKGTHYLIPNYDVSRYIPAERINANIPRFFQEAREGINAFKQCIQNLPDNGRVLDNGHEWILQGNDPIQNVFTIHSQPNGVINKALAFHIPDDSLAIVRVKTGPRAHLQFGIWGDQQHANHTLYLFEDATNIHMEVPAAIWGSVIAPQAIYHGHPTGGHISGNVALGSLAVNPASGFEIHWYPFIGGIRCADIGSLPTPEPVPEQRPSPEPIPCPEPAPCPEQRPCPEPAPCPEQRPCPEPAPCPEQRPCPEPAPCPEQRPCPEPAPCPEQRPCPKPAPCPEQKPCPEPAPCPEQRPCPKPAPCPEQRPCPKPAPCPEQRPCPEPAPCPKCPSCPEQRPCPKCPPCPKYPPCPPCPKPPTSPITSGLIQGSVSGCRCSRGHKWEIALYKTTPNSRTRIFCETLSCNEMFEIRVPYDGQYLLIICLPRNCRRSSRCKPSVIFKNIGVAHIMIDY